MMDQFFLWICGNNRLASSTTGIAADSRGLIFNRMAVEEFFQTPRRSKARWLSGSPGVCMYVFMYVYA